MTDITSRAGHIAWAKYYEINISRMS